MSIKHVVFSYSSNKYRIYGTYAFLLCLRSFEHRYYEKSVFQMGGFFATPFINVAVRSETQSVAPGEGEWIWGMPLAPGRSCCSNSVKLLNRQTFDLLYKMKVSHGSQEIRERPHTAASEQYSSSKCPLR